MPLPVDPIKATVSPVLAVKEIFSRIYSSASGYLKETFLNSTVPSLPGIFFFIVPFLIVLLVSNTSFILLAHTSALGSIIKIIASIKKAIITCIAYDENTIISPNNTILSLKFELLIRIAPIKYIARVKKYITIYITGLKKLNAFWLNSCWFVNFVFTLSNFSSWYSSALKALTTLIPDRFSLVTELILSISSCTTLNLGITMAIIIPIVINSTSTAMAVTILHSILLPNILVIAHTAVTGALIISCIPIAISISIWVISFVVLVIRLLVENFLMSSALKFSTFLNTFSLVLSEKEAAIKEAKYPTITADTRLPKAHKSI